jgi:hypothetical protein
MDTYEPAQRGPRQAPIASPPGAGTLPAENASHWQLAVPTARSSMQATVLTNTKRIRTL